MHDSQPHLIFLIGSSEKKQFFPDSSYRGTFMPGQSHRLNAERVAVRSPAEPARSDFTVNIADYHNELMPTSSGTGRVHTVVASHLSQHVHSPITQLSPSKPPPPRFTQLQPGEDAWVAPPFQNSISGLKGRLHIATDAHLVGLFG